MGEIPEFCHKWWNLLLKNGVFLYKIIFQLISLLLFKKIIVVVCLSEEVISVTYNILAVVRLPKGFFFKVSKKVLTEILNPVLSFQYLVQPTFDIKPPSWVSTIGALLQHVINCMKSVTVGTHRYKNLPVVFFS